MSETLRVLRTDAEITELLEYISDPALVYVAYDTETTGLSLDAQVIGFSVCADIDLGFYVVLGEWRGTGGLVWLDNRDSASKVLEILRSKSLIMHNAVVDINWTKVNFGVDFMPALHTDTMLLAHLVDENRRVGLKELAYTIFGEGAKQEQEEMQASVIANGGVWEKARGGNKEMYKADSDLVGRYGAKDTVLTLKLFYHLLPQLFEEGLDKFFYEDETMPLLKSATYDMNTVGLKLDLPAIQELQKELELNITTLQDQIQSDIRPYILEAFPKGFGKGKKQFNLNSKQHMSWLLFVRLRNQWKKLTKGGRKVAKALCGGIPYSPKARLAFQQALEDPPSVPGSLPKIVKYIQCDKNALLNLEHKYVWVERLLKHNQDVKILGTYAIGLQKREYYGVIHPSFLQHGTTSGRYSSRDPNFQNLPRDDTRIKKCIVARPGHVFVGADFSQLEARVFAFMSGDETLIASFEKGEDFYSIIGMNVFQKFDCTPHKSGANAFGVKYKSLRQIAKNTALAATYGTTAFRLTDMLRDDEGHNIPPKECQVIIDDYFEAYPQIKLFQQKMHWEAIEKGYVASYFGRKRRIPMATRIKKLLSKGEDASDLPYEYRTLLNLAVNHSIQSTAASVVNRAAIAFRARADLAGLPSPIVLQIHDELVVETLEQYAKQVRALLKDCMENTTVFPGMRFPAEPKIARTLADLK